MYQLRLLGSLSLEATPGTASATLVRQRPLAVLALLAVAGDAGCSRDKLIGYLWPEVEPERARHRLADAIYLLRKSLGEDAVLAAGDTVRLNPEVVAADAACFLERLDGNDLEAAVELYRGPLLDGFYVNGAPEFERWSESERQRFADAYGGALEELAEKAETAGDFRRAVDWWKRLAARDPYNSRYVLRLMEALAAVGDPANALEALRVHELRLRDELGLELPEELRKSAGRLQAEPVMEGRASGESEGLRLASSEGRVGALDAELESRAGLASRAKRYWLVGGLTTAVVVIGGLAWHIGWGAARGPTVEHGSIAVLPLENLSPDPEDAYFADAIHGEIINRLGTIEGLRVISRTSVMSYGQRTGNLRDIAEQLGVENILEGTVRRVGDRVRITIELVVADRDQQVWSESYESDISDIFAIQADVARQVVTALSVALARDERERIEARSTDNSEAYDYYLRGVDYFRRSYDEGDLRVAQQMFEMATHLDPGFALAHARLSRTHSRIYWFFYDRSQARLEQAKQAVDRALELEPDLPEAHEAMGWYYYYGFLDYDRALRRFELALGRQPGNSDLLQGMAYVERRRGDLEAHLNYLARAERLDPRNGGLLQNIAQTHGRLLRDYAEAERYYDRSLALAPDLPRSYGYKALLFLAWEGSTAKARAVLEEAARKGLDPVDDPFVGYRWAQVDIYDGNFEAALARLSTGSSTIFNTQFYYVPKALVAAQVYDLMGEEGPAREHYDSAAALLEARLAEAPDEARLYSALGIAYAGLGRVEEAIRTASKGVDLLPVSRDAHRGLWRVEDLARVYTMVGRFDEAIDQLDHLLSIPGDLSVPLLRIDPTWGSLRDHPRFQALLAKYE